MGANQLLPSMAANLLIADKVFDTDKQSLTLATPSVRK